MSRESIVQEKITAYQPKGLIQSSRLFLALAGINHESTKNHVENVALLAEAVAISLKKDAKAAFFAGLLHDIAKITLPAPLFDGHNITPEEYAQIKKHAQDGFNALMKLHLFTSLCAGLHHNLYKSGYGVTMEDFPKNWSPATIKKVLDISMIISICDFIEAFTHRPTKILDGSDKAPDLKSMLHAKYPDDIVTVDTALNLYPSTFMRDITSKELNKQDIEQILTEHFKAERTEVKVVVPVIGHESQFEGGATVYGVPIVTALVIGTIQRVSV